MTLLIYIVRRWFTLYELDFSRCGEGRSRLEGVGGYVPFPWRLLLLFASACLVELSFYSKCIFYHITDQEVGNKNKQRVGPQNDKSTTLKRRKLWWTARDQEGQRNKSCLKLNFLLINYTVLIILKEKRLQNILFIWVHLPLPQSWTSAWFCRSLTDVMLMSFNVWKCVCVGRISIFLPGYPGCHKR